ncbi:Mobile element protein [Lactiplantibacillus plantarum]|nr:Mobile element protein [Lactiplantibacillus plantarum]
MPVIKMLLTLYKYQYFPKGTVLNDTNDQEGIAFVTYLNDHPCKVLGWRSSSKVFFYKTFHSI